MAGHGKRAKSAAVVLVGTIIIVVAAYGFWELTDPRPKPSGRVIDLSMGPMASTPFVMSGIDNPIAISANAAALKDDERVIGIVVVGRPRAYRMSAFVGLPNHVVNDLISGSPITVTHCDITNCTRVYSGSGEKPLAIGTGAFADGLILRVNDIFYSQETGMPLDPSASVFPFPRCEFQETTWKAWRLSHPKTDVYVEPPKRVVGATPPEIGPKK